MGAHQQDIGGYNHVNTITLKGIIDEDFINYKLPSMTLMFPTCTFKCGNDLCQNRIIAEQTNITVPITTICDRYISNPITQAIVFQGLEPLDSFDECLALIDCLRNTYNCKDDVVIYTGYNKEEITDKIELLKPYGNIAIKYGRFIPNDSTHMDKVIGVRLASQNQWAEYFF